MRALWNVSERLPDCDMIFSEGKKFGEDTEKKSRKEKKFMLINTNSKDELGDWMYCIWVLS